MFVWARALTRLDALEARVLALERGRGLEAQILELETRVVALELALRRQGLVDFVSNAFFFFNFHSNMLIVNEMF